MKAKKLDYKKMWIKLKAKISKVYANTYSEEALHVLQDIKNEILDLEASHEG